MAESDVTHGLPRDLAALLRDQSVIVPMHAAVFETIASWAKAPAATASADIALSTSDPVFGRYAAAAGKTIPTTTPAGCR